MRNAYLDLADPIGHWCQIYHTYFSSIYLVQGDYTIEILLLESWVLTWAENSYGKKNKININTSEKYWKVKVLEKKQTKYLNTIINFY